MGQLVDKSNTMEVDSNRAKSGPDTPSRNLRSRRKPQPSQQEDRSSARTTPAAAAARYDKIFN